MNQNTGQDMPVFRVNVFARTTKAVNYRHRGGSTTVDFRGTDLMPAVGGHAKVDVKTAIVEELSAVDKSGVVEDDDAAVGELGSGMP